MIDLDQLRRSAEGEGESAVVSRRFLAQAADEIAAGRRAIGELARMHAVDGVCAAIERRGPSTGSGLAG